MTGPYITLADAGGYCGRTGTPSARARWARRHIMPNIPHIHPPGSGVVFRKSDIDAWLRQFEVAPPDVGALAAEALRAVQGGRGAR